MTWQERKKLREERAKLHADMKALDKKASDEKRSLNEVETNQFDELELRSQELASQIERGDRVANLENANRDQETRSKGASGAGGPGHGDLDDTTRLDVPEKDLRSYSLLKVIRAQVEHRSLDGLERELSDEIALRSQKQPTGVYVPHDIPIETRDLTLTTGAGAIATNTMPTLIEMLRARVLVASLGARMMGGLVGDLSVPKQTGGATSYWVTEGNAPTKTNQTVGQVGLAPKTVGAYTDMSRKFVRQSSIDAEQFVRNDLMEVIARAIDKAVLNGSGTGAEPEGILQNASVPTVALGTNGAAPTFAKMVALESTIASSDADMGKLAYVTNAVGRGCLKTTQKVTGEARFIWEGSEVNGYSANATNLLPSNLTKGTGTNLSPIIFGNWMDILIGMWGGLDILVDPYTGGNAGNVRVNALQDVDIALRHDESFAKIVDMITA